jgi:hypothetical protein
VKAAAMPCTWAILHVSHNDPTGLLIFDVLRRRRGVILGRSIGSSPSIR